jgi:outer membrane biosynthesis protein TonB
MPYLHFETNEGRIRLSNAIKRTVDDSPKVDTNSDGNDVKLFEETEISSNSPSSSKLESESDTESVSESHEQSSDTEVPFKNDDDPSDTEPEEVHDESKDEKPVHRIKSGSNPSAGRKSMLIPTREIEVLQKGNSALSRRALARRTR